MRPALLFVLTLAAVMPLTAAAVTDFSGTRTEGERLVFTAAGVRVGELVVAWADCDTVELLDASPVADHLGPVVLLRDGSRLPTDALASKVDDAVQVTTALGSFELALGDHVLGWGSSAWLAQAQGDRDRLLISTDRGESVLDGEVLGIAEGKVIFEATDVGEIEKPLADVVGLRLAIGVEPVQGIHLVAALIADQAPCAFVVRDGQLQLAAVEAELETPPAGILQVDGGRRVWLEDVPLVADAVVEEGAFGVVWKHRFGSLIDGGPIVLRGAVARHGVVAHAKAVLVWDLAGKFDRFRADMGVPDALGVEGDCEVTILVDGKVVLPVTRIRGAAPVVSIDIDCRGGKRLEWRIEYGRRYDIGDHVALAHAWLLRSP